MRKWLITVFLLVIACGGEIVGGGGGGDDTVFPSDAGTDATTSDAGPSLGDFREIGDSTNWASLDVNALVGVSGGFYGGTFDGRYLYLAPSVNSETGMPHGHALRFDTLSSFTAASAWSTFDTTTLAPTALGFAGAAFDGRYVYFAPNGGEVDVQDVYYAFQPSSTFVRYDTLGSFTDAAAWTTFELRTLSPQAQGYCGVTFDGRYLYLVPYGPDGDQVPDAGVTESLAVRYDTKSSFADSSSYALMDLTLLPNEPSRRCGATFDGHYLYLSEEQNEADVTGVMTRYDTSASFTESSSWTTFNVATVNPKAQGFAGAAFDGRSLYVMSYWFGDSFNQFYDGITARYDTEPDNDFETNVLMNLLSRECV
ncbi:MAG: hypothetical protein ABI183_12420 [Polyangiaceae bacterium]